MKILILGGDGFCGWPTALRLSKNGYEITIIDNLSRRKIDKEFKVIIDRKEGNYFVGRTQFDSPDVDNEVLINAKKSYIRSGDFATVKIISAEDFDLYAEVVL